MKTWLVSVFFLISSLLSAAGLPVPAGIDHRDFDALLGKYVDEQGLVDYKGWKASATDLKRLDAYLEQFAPEAGAKAEGGEHIASLANAYNAFTLRMILQNMPLNSIMDLEEPFKQKQHLISGKTWSLDEIEHTGIRPIIGWKVHSMVVCAAVSCPPLAQNAFQADSWEEVMEERHRVWFAREDLNQFDEKNKELRLSKLFEWYAGDYEGDHRVEALLKKYGPESARKTLKKRKVSISYLDYDWSLNIQKAN